VLDFLELAKPKYFKNLPGFNKITTSKIKIIHWGVINLNYALDFYQSSANALQ
jgi:hypothetical protein